MVFSEAGSQVGQGPISFYCVASHQHWYCRHVVTAESSSLLLLLLLLLLLTQVEGKLCIFCSTLLAENSEVSSWLWGLDACGCLADPSGRLCTQVPVINCLDFPSRWHSGCY